MFPYQSFKFYLTKIYYSVQIYYYKSCCGNHLKCEVCTKRKAIQRRNVIQKLPIIRWFIYAYVFLTLFSSQYFKVMSLRFTDVISLHQNIYTTVSKKLQYEELAYYILIQNLGEVHRCHHRCL